MFLLWRVQCRYPHAIVCGFLACLTTGYSLSPQAILAKAGGAEGRTVVGGTGHSHLMKAPGHAISQKICNFFREVGVQCYRHPGPFFWGPVLLTIFSVAGLLRFHEENRIWYLYSPSTADSHFEHAVANEFFNDRGGKFWLELTISAHDLGNLLRQDHFEDVVSLADFLQYNFTVVCDVKGRSLCSFNDLCSGSTCTENQVVPLFNLIYRNASSRLHPNFRLSYPTMHLYNDDYYVGEHFAGVQIDHNTNVISSIKVVVLFFRTDQQNEEVGKTLKRWESKLFDYVDHFQHPNLNISVNSDAMIAQEVRSNGMSCIPYFGFSIILVYIFIMLSTRREHFPALHLIIMSFLGIIGPLMAAATAFCLLFMCGVPFNSITLVMPFLIIGVGSDDVFIIIHAMRKTDKRKPLEEQIAETMEEAGPSITVTSATNILSFAVGIATPTPAISIFCLYTSVALTVDFIYQLTFFVAALVYEEHRVRRSMEKPPIEDAKIKAVVCAQPSIRSVHPVDPNGLIARYCTFLQKWQTRIVLLIILIGYWSASLYGCLTMQVKMDTTNLIMKGSPLHNIAFIYEQFLWKEGQLVMVFVNSPPDLSDDDHQREMLGLVDRFEHLPYSMGRNSTSFWLRSFLYQSALYHTKDGFYTLLQQWLMDPENGGQRWNDMIRLQKDANGSVVGVDKFMFATACAMGDDANWLTRAHLQKEWRTLAEEYTNYNVSVFQSYSFYVDQLDSIGPNTLSTVIVAAITMDLACFLMIPSASSIVSSTVAMISINVGVFGLLSLWNVNLDPITMCTTLMSLGFSVDFTAHISYHYYRNPLSWTSVQRLADALRSIGWPMMQAGTSTILCVTPLLLIDSYMVHVFSKTIFLVISLGLLHGIIFLPALLITVGRSSPDSEADVSMPRIATKASDLTITKENSGTALTEKRYREQG